MADFDRASRAQIGSRLFEGTRLGPSRFALDLDAINLVARPAIWGESGVSMMTSMPDPPYKISRNFKLQSCGPNLSWGAIKFVRLDNTITQSTLNEQAEHRPIEFARGGQPSQTEQGTDRFALVRGNKTRTLSPRFTPRCSTCYIDEKRVSRY